LVGPGHCLWVCPVHLWCCGTETWLARLPLGSWLTSLQGSALLLLLPDRFILMFGCQVLHRERLPCQMEPESNIASLRGRENSPAKNN